MSINKLSERLMDAYMVGDAGRIKKLQEEIQKASQNAQPKRKTTTIQINTVLNDDEASATSVYDFLNKSIGEDWWEIEFDALERLLFIKYGIALEDINRDKIWAIRHVCRSDRSFSDWFEFNQCALSFSGAIADFDHLRSPSAGMIINAVKTLNHIRPDRKSEFGNDVINYICVALKDSGIYTPPPSIAMLIHEKMGKMVSPKLKSEWMGIIKKYQGIVGKKIKEFEENITDIQAKRLVRAEAAALKYGSR